tara:strand:+ start:174 stop:464 length:291 start_codon:yes stop_codon:yes gene_type:complete
MADRKPIHLIAKDLGVDTKKVIQACNQIGIYAKGASKRLDHKEEEKIKNYFNNGKNVSNEVIDIKINSLKETKNEKAFPIKSTNNKYFINRLIKEI